MTLIQYLKFQCMKNTNLYFVIVFAFLVSIPGCKKDDIHCHGNHAGQHAPAQRLVFNVTDDDINTRSTGATNVRTVLGALRQNPFTAQKLEGPTFNNIEVNYNMWTEQGFRTHMYWGAATVNNAVHEMHDYAAQDGINPPENGLDIYIGRNNTHGYALMSAQKYLSGAMGTAMGVATFWAGPWSVLIGLIGWGATILYLPDVYVGIDFQNSDRLKALAFHELAHASHYSQVGKDYWIGLVEAEILANGHGDQQSHDAGRIALCESWAGHIGHAYTHRTYGNDFSGFQSWNQRLEETWNESFNHIPIGLYHDLADVGEPVRTVGGITFSACNQDGSGCTVIDDPVSDFTLRQMFLCLTPAVTTVDQFRQNLIANHLTATSNTEAQVNTLFNQY